MSQMTNVAGVVILFHPPSNFMENIHSYVEHISTLFVIDNSPTSNSHVIDAEKNDKLKYFHADTNIGVAAALNMGCRRSIELGYEWILTMDQDSRFEGNNAQILFDGLKGNLSAGLVCPFQMYHERPLPTKKEFEEISFTITSGSILNLRAFQAIGGFVEKLFIDSIDTEYCLKLRRSGWKIVQINGSLLNHNLGNPSRHNFLLRKTITSNHTAVRRYYIARNRLYLLRHYPESIYLELRNWSLEIVKIILYEENKIQKLLFTIKGILDFFRGKFGMLK